MIDVETIARKWANVYELALPADLEGGYDAADQVIVVENVDLTSGLGSDQLIIQDLINKGKLITD